MAIATLMCFIGICLLAGRWMRVAIWQYVLKDVILVGVGMVIAAATFRGGRLVRDDMAPGPHARVDASLDGDQKLRLLLESAGDRDSSATVCERLGISEAEMHHCREVARAGAARALTAVSSERAPADR